MREGGEEREGREGRKGRRERGARELRRGEKGREGSVCCDLSLALTNDSRQLRLHKSIARFLSTPVDDWSGSHDPWINVKDV